MKFEATYTDHVEFDLTEKQLAYWAGRYAEESGEPWNDLSEACRAEWIAEHWHSLAIDEGRLEPPALQSIEFVE